MTVGITHGDIPTYSGREQEPKSIHINSTAFPASLWFVETNELYLHTLSLVSTFRFPDSGHHLVLSIVFHPTLTQCLRLCTNVCDKYRPYGYHKRLYPETGRVR